MKILIAYPNLPMMLTPAVSVGIFTSILKEMCVDVELFETTTYTDDVNQGMVHKSKLGSGRQYTLSDIKTTLKPTNLMLPDFVSKVQSFKPDLILFSTVEDTFKDTVMMLTAVEHLNVPHIVGGVFPINAPDICLSSPVIKNICTYEGEYVIRDVVNAWREGLDWTKVKGLNRNPLQPLVDINEVIPDYCLYDPARFYRPMGGKIVKAIQLETYRGCPYSCTFCNSPATRNINKNYLRRKTIVQVEKELQYYVENFDPEYWFIIDDSFLARPRHEMFQLLTLLEKYNIPWWCNTRIENVDTELLAAMKKAHCDRIQFGVECGNEEYRFNVLKRPVTNKSYLKKASIINSCGIPYGLNVIIGLPNETREHVFETIDLVKKFAGYDSLSVSIFIPYRGTDLRQSAVDQGYLRDDWISSNGYLLGGSPLRMPHPYLQPDEILHLAERFKYYCFFERSMWNDIDRSSDLSGFESIYNTQFYSPLAQPGSDNIRRRKSKVWACEASDCIAF
jgi:anaerobic magnesium-protoporphyrin IX monomethyl ester cyclase